MTFYLVILYLVKFKIPFNCVFKFLIFYYISYKFNALSILSNELKKWFIFFRFSNDFDN